MAQFSGSDRLIADYLSEEVLEAQPRAAARLPPGELRARRDVCRSGGPPDRGTRCPAGPRGAGAGVDVPRPPGRPPRSGTGSIICSGICSDSGSGPRTPGPSARLLELAAVVAPGTGGGRPGHRVPACGPGLGRVLELIMSPGNRDLRAGSDGHGVRWISQMPETKPRAGRRREPPPRLLKGAEGQAAGAEDIVRRVAADPRAPAGERACAQAFLATMVQFRHQPRDHDARWPWPPSAMLDPRRGPPAGRDEPDRSPVPGDHGPRLRRSGPLPRRADWRRPGAWLERGLASAGAAYSVWRVSGLGSLGLLEAWAASSSGPRSWPTRPWLSPAMWAT